MTERLPSPRRPNARQRDSTYQTGQRCSDKRDRLCVTSPQAALMRPANTLFSGPSAGVIGGLQAARMAGTENAITFDMGGTSTDVCLVDRGAVSMVYEKDIAGTPVRSAMVDVNSVGAGGGSVAWIDAGGRLKVGPSSAGASPGPAAYGQGGEEPTVTDANLLLGRLSRRGLLEGRMPLYPELSRGAIQDRVAKPLGMDAVEAAWGIVQIVNTNTVLAIRAVSVQRGYDPRDFTLVAFGGAGPLHATAVARLLGISPGGCPPSPGHSLRPGAAGDGPPHGLCPDFHSATAGRGPLLR